MAIFRDMRFTRTGLPVVLGLMLAGLPVEAVNRTVKPGDYSAIENRNPFGLVDPPKPAVIVAPVPPVETEPPPNVELTGMFHDSVRGKTFALFLVQVKGETKKRSYMLSEGENQDGLKVEAIDRKASNVKINLKGNKSTITYNKPKAAAVAKNALPQRPGEGGRPSPRTLPAPGASNPGPTPGVTRQFSTTGGRQGTFGGTRRSVNVVGGGMSSTADIDPGQVPIGNGSLRSIPARQMRTAPTMTRQEQEILIEATRARNELLQQRNPGGPPIMPPLPPTSLTTPDVLQRIVVPPSVPGGQ